MNEDEKQIVTVEWPTKMIRFYDGSYEHIEAITAQLRAAAQWLDEHPDILVHHISYDAGDEDPSMTIWYQPEDA